MDSSLRRFGHAIHGFDAGWRFAVGDYAVAVGGLCAVATFSAVGNFSVAGGFCTVGELGSVDGFRYGSARGMADLSERLARTKNLFDKFFLESLSERARVGAGGRMFRWEFSRFSCDVFQDFTEILLYWIFLHVHSERLRFSTLEAPAIAHATLAAA